jgi:uncharacterized damage-inducible protein DinB
MRYQDQLIRDTRNATDALFKAARAMPEDKLKWKVMDKGRSALDLCAECAQMIPSTIEMLEAKALPPMDPAAYEAMQAERAAWSLDDCERICRESSEKLYDVLRDYPDQDLEQRIDLPFGDRAWTMADVASYPLWNLTYHLGQIGYILTLYGDTEMYL